MEDKEYYPVPTKEEMRNRRNIQIQQSTNKELYKLYDEAVSGIWYFGGNEDLKADFKKDKILIKLELKNRGLKVPNWIYEIGLYFNNSK
ncbi:hypothetical protein ACWO4B_003209 [Clostridium sporogenes]